MSYNPDQPRDDRGRWGEGGGDSAHSVAASHQRRIAAQDAKMPSAIRNVMSPPIKKVSASAKPQGGMYATHKTLGRVWVESVSSGAKGTALIRSGKGFGGKKSVVPLSEVDFTRPSGR